MSDEAATVFVVDDDPDLRQSVTWMLRKAGFEVEAFPSAEQFLADFDDTRPGCVVVDVKMPGMSGLDLQQRLLDRHLHTPLIFITGHADVPMAVRAMESGAVAFLEKPFSRTHLLDRVEKAMELDRHERAHATDCAAARALYGQLTPREREVMGRVIDGATTKQIAHELGTSIRTVEGQRSQVMKKMGVASVAELTALAVRSGLDASGGVR